MSSRLYDAYFDWYKLTPNDDKDSLEEDGMAVSKIPVRTLMVVIEPKPSNIIVFFPFNAYILKTLLVTSTVTFCDGFWWILGE